MADGVFDRLLEAERAGNREREETLRRLLHIRNPIPDVDYPAPDGCRYEAGVWLICAPCRVEWGIRNHGTEADRFWQLRHRKCDLGGSKQVDYRPVHRCQRPAVLWLYRRNGRLPRAACAAHLLGIRDAELDRWGAAFTDDRVEVDLVAERTFLVLAGGTIPLHPPRLL